MDCGDRRGGRFSRRWPAALLVVVLGVAVVGSCSSNTAEQEKQEQRTSRSHVSMGSETRAYIDSLLADEASAQAEAIDPATATNPDGKPISKARPYVGMPAELIDATGLGAHDAVGESPTGGLNEGSIPFEWHAQNGTDDQVFTAYVRGGKVIYVRMENLYTTYWYDPATGEEREMPDRTASGERVKVKTLPPVYVDPGDYDDPDDYADNAQSYFEYIGSTDAWNEAYRHWEAVAS